MRKVLFIISCLLFCIGFLFSGFLTKYFLQESYYPAVFHAYSYVSGGNGTTSRCWINGRLDEDAARVVLACDLFHLAFPAEKITAWGSNVEDGPYISLPVFASPNGQVHIYDNQKNKYLPGVKKMNILSTETFLMGQFIFISLLLLATKKSKLSSISLILFLTTFGSSSTLFSQIGHGDTLTQFGTRTVEIHKVNAEFSAYGQDFSIKKTEFDSTKYLLKYPEECLLCELSASSREVLAYCSQNRTINKKEGHFKAIALMDKDFLFFSPTIKLVFLENEKMTAYIKYFIIDRKKNRKILSLKKLIKKETKWLLSDEKTDGQMALAILAINDKVFNDLIQGLLPKESPMREVQNESFREGTFNLVSFSRAFKTWHVKNKDSQNLIEAFTQNLIQPL